LLIELSKVTGGAETSDDCIKRLKVELAVKDGKL
jgi:hypothetical protein